MNPAISPLRNNLVSGLLWLSFICACLFWGIGENLIMLSAAAAFTVTALLLTGPWPLWQRLRAREWSVWLALAVILILVISYQFVSISPESSFAASWLLACVPVWYLVCVSLSNREPLRILLCGTVGLLALLSVVRFLWIGERAHAPLMDPNNYASLLYLIWIPGCGLFLHLSWSGDGNPSRRFTALGFSASLLLTMAVFATSSRAGSLIVVVALAGWLLFTLLRRYSLQPWILLALSVAAAYVLCLLQTPQSLSASMDPMEMSSGVSLRGALTESGLRMLMTAPLGSGLFTFPLLYPLYRQAGDQSTAGMFVHNDYLQLLVETGPWLVAILLVVAVVVALRLLRILGAGGDSAETSGDQGAVVTFGIGMAILALLAHATINFVFYILPLGMVFAALCAEFFTRELTASERSAGPATDVSAEGVAAQADPEAGVHTGSVGAMAGWATAMALTLACWGYLLLETVTQGVFGGQPAPAVVREIRQDPAAMLRFARFAQAMNDTASVPVLGEALVRSAQLKEPAADELELAEILQLFRRAMALDPFNPFVYESFYQFLRDNMSPALAQQLRPEEAPVPLLQQAVRLDVRRADNIFELIRIYDQLGQSDKALELLKISVFPWLERMQWHNPPAAQALIAEMRRRAELADDQPFLAQIDERVARISRISNDPPSRGWLKRLGEATSG